MNGLIRHNEKIKELVEEHLNELFIHFEFYEINLDIFTTQWLLDLFSHIIPLADYHLFLDEFINHSWKFVYRLILVFLKELEPEIMAMDDWGDILEFIKSEVPKLNWKK